MPVVEGKYEKVKAIIARYRHDRLYLLQALDEIQHCLGYIPEPVIAMIAQEFHLAKIDIAGVVSFYSRFSTRPLAKYVIRCCKGVSCVVCGGAQLYESIRKTLKIKDGESTKDGKFFLQVVPCLGECDHSPAIMINDRRFGNMDAASIEKLLLSIQRKGLEGETS